MNIAIIGVGAYSLAMVKMLLKNEDNKVKVWTENPIRVEEFNKTKRFSSIFEEIDFSGIELVSTSYEEVLKDADIIFIMVAAQYLDDVSNNIKDLITPNMSLIVCSKGIEQDSCLFADELVLKNLDIENFAVISGPSFAIDMVNGDPVGLSIASKSIKAIEEAKKVLNNGSVKLWETEDILGTEICGSIKNVIAIAAGMIDGLGYSESTQAFLITEALHDIKELINALGGNKKSILSLAGVGDLLLTCTSKKSRNYSFGYILGSKSSKEEIDNYLKTTTVEGFYTLKSIHNLVKQKEVDMPIIELIYGIVMNNDNPKILIDYLINK